jgi:hypothetical protein
MSDEPGWWVRAGPRTAPLTRARFLGLVIWQVLIAFMVGWGTYAVVWGGMILLGRSAGSAAMVAMILVGILICAVGALTAGGPASNGPGWAESWFADRLGTDAREFEARGLTFRAQCLLVGVTMLAIAGLAST